MPENEFIKGKEEEENCAKWDIHGFDPYLGNEADADRMPKEPIWPGVDALNNTYVCIVHTNGIHHLAMVTCHWHGEHNVALDLVASQLLPASFTKIHTLFTTLLMDYFWLCNLELKALAYQFYQLICQLMRLDRKSVV